jgi:hypothetical protein
MEGYAEIASKPHLELVLVPGVKPIGLIGNTSSLLRLELALSISVPVETEQTNKTALVGGSRVNMLIGAQKIWDPDCVLIAFGSQC